MDPTARQVAIMQRLEQMTPEQRANLALLATPRMVQPYIKHIPHPTQQVFLSLNRYREVMFGGAAGGGKSDALLMAALQYVDVPGYAALILRRTWPDLALPGAIMDRATQWLNDTPATKREGGRLWIFPSGARLQFGHLGNEQDKYRYQSAEFQFVGFDELTQFPEESQYDYLFSRVRRPALSCMNCTKPLQKLLEKNTGRQRWIHTRTIDRKTCKSVVPDPKVLEQYPPAPDGTSIFDVPLRVRSATNPGGRGMLWVKDRLVNSKTRRKDTVFVPSTLNDNPSLDQDGYKESLEYLNAVDKERLLHGDWEIVEQGDIFDRGDFTFVDRAPANIKYKVRFWDFAASEGKGDWTVGALCGVTDDGMFVIEDVVRIQKHSHDVEKVVMKTANVDGIKVAIRQEQEPGSSGKAIVDHYRRNVLMGYNYDGIRSTGSKEARATAFSSYVKGGKVLCLSDRWTRPMLDEMEQFPRGIHDDQVDAVSGAFNFLMLVRRARLLV